jgi:hypothetical protein
MIYDCRWESPPAVGSSPSFVFILLNYPNRHRLIRLRKAWSV